MLCNQGLISYYYLDQQTIFSFPFNQSNKDTQSSTDHICELITSPYQLCAHRWSPAEASPCDRCHETPTIVWRLHKEHFHFPASCSGLHTSNTCVEWMVTAGRMVRSFRFPAFSRLVLLFCNKFVIDYHGLLWRVREYNEGTLLCGCRHAWEIYGCVIFLLGGPIAQRSGSW